MSAQKCQKCGVRVFFYRDETTGAEKCPSCGTTNPHTPEKTLLLNAQALVPSYSGQCSNWQNTSSLPALLLSPLGL
jgi:ribosomal protein L40E